jgi:hypothetical protein
VNSSRPRRVLAWLVVIAGSLMSVVMAGGLSTGSSPIGGVALTSVFHFKSMQRSFRSTPL